MGSKRVILGTIIYQPIKMKSNLYCEKCDVTCGRPSDWERHIKTTKHLRVRENDPEITRKFICSDCDYKCCKSSILERHKLSKRHNNRVKSNFRASVLDTPGAYVSENSVSSSQNHCSENYAFVPEISRTDYMSIISELFKQNNELKNLIIEQKNDTIDIVNKVIETVKPINNTINTNNNNNNNKFNINLFLNEQCKDAFNFNEFVNNIKISYQDLENNAQLGFVQGISKIFMDNLKQLGINERPIHCTDVKRETMYIKDENKWTKEVDDSKLQKAIQTVSYKSMGKLMEWKQENPDYQDMDSEFSKRCLDIQRQTLAGSDRDVYYPKVIHVLAKETMVDK
jgi:hypothetical protein